MANIEQRGCDSSGIIDYFNHPKNRRAASSGHGSGWGVGKRSGMGVMQTNLIVGAALLGISFIGLNFGVGVQKTAAKISAPPPPISMKLQSLEYKKGMFGQAFEVEGGIIQADWAAEITRSDMSLCAGGGTAPYEGRSELEYYYPDKWTGDTCPSLQVGDVARAVWTYRTVDGLFVSISGEITIQE